MGKFVLLYKGGSGMPETEEEQASVMAAWTSWLGDLGDSIVDVGNPFGASSAVNGGGVSGLTGYSILSADGLDDAVGKAKGCPILTAGGDVEVYEALPM
jgi:hypothetical protein